MTAADRIKAFAKLGEELNELSSSEQSRLGMEAANLNPWFTVESVTTSLRAVAQLLSLSALEAWTSTYTFNGQSPKTVGVVMAGNIPLVGFHDFLCVLISGNRLKAKLSSQDAVLLVHLGNILLTIEPRFSSLIQWTERLDTIDAVIATGSDNTSRYFDYYFRHVPRIIRKNRSSAAILSGNETREDLILLGHDIFCYYGLGCRNISQILVPVGFDLNLLTKAWQDYRKVMNVSRYVNNYDYQKATLLVNRFPFHDTGFLLIKEDSSLVSPVAVLHVDHYSTTLDLQQKLLIPADKLQCLVSKDQWFPGSVGFGKAQFPLVSDYADHIDTMKFLTNH